MWIFDEVKRNETSVFRLEGRAFYIAVTTHNP